MTPRMPGHISAQNKEHYGAEKSCIEQRIEGTLEPSIGRPIRAQNREAH